MKSKIISGIIMLAAFALVSGAGMLAFAVPGTQSDPFITLSYLTEIFKPQVMAEVSRAGQDLTQSFEARIRNVESQIQANQGSAAATPSPADVFSVVTLTRGQSLTCSVGAEIMLRIGAATGFGTAPALVDYTVGEAFSSGSALTPNHMYLVTIEGNGIRAAADTVRVLVRGNYSIT